MPLRIAQPGDRGAVRAFLARLSPGTVQARFLSSSMSLAGPSGDRELNRMLERNESQHVVVLAVDGAEIRGIGEFFRAHGNRADLGLVVEDAFQGRGIGRSLFRKLEELALERGIRAFTGDMAYGNARAGALLRGAGRRLQIQAGHGGVHFTLPLEPGG
jgi:GNAT superfamily N-acetyltransferase